MPEHDCLPPDVSATEFVTHMARVSGLPSGAARERTADVLRHVGLYEERYRPIGGYSTGMKQRVKLAQALVHDPKVLFLDEPTNGLDPAGRDEMLALIERIGREFGIAVIVASHLLGEIERVATWLMAIDAGQLLRTAPLASFTERTGQLLIETDEDAAAARRAPRRRAGSTARADGRTVLVDLASGGDGEFDVYDAVRDEAVALGLALVRIEHRRHQLEDLFRVGGTDDARRLRPSARSTTSATATTTGRGSAGAGAIGAIVGAGLRAVFGLGRSGRSKILPWGAAGAGPRAGRRRGRHPRPRR